MMAITSVKSGLEALAAQLEDSTHNVMGDIIEPLSTFAIH
jgi:hypothetical protein